MAISRLIACFTASIVSVYRFTQHKTYIVDIIQTFFLLHFVCVCVCACVRACARARACMCVCVCVCVRARANGSVVNHCCGRCLFL